MIAIPTGKPYSRRYVSGKTDGSLRPLKGGRSVKFYGYPGKLNASDQMSYTLYSHKELQSLFPEGTVSPVAKTLNGRRLMRGYTK